MHSDNARRCPSRRGQRSRVTRVQLRCAHAHAARAGVRRRTSRIFQRSALRRLARPRGCRSFHSFGIKLRHKKCGSGRTLALAPAESILACFAKHTGGSVAAGAPEVRAHSASACCIRAVRDQRFRGACTCSTLRASVHVSSFPARRAAPPGAPARPQDRNVYVRNSIEPKLRKRSLRARLHWPPAVCRLPRRHRRAAPRFLTHTRGRLLGQALRAVTSAQCGLRATQRRVARFAGLEDFRAVPLAASRILLGANAKEYS